MQHFLLLFDKCCIQKCGAAAFFAARTDKKSHKNRQEESQEQIRRVAITDKTRRKTDIRVANSHKKCKITLN